MGLMVNEFGKDFHWGVSTAAYQIEGAHDKDGKAPSIWDTFTSNPKNIHKGQHGNIACDFYHRYAQDINLIHQLQIPNFRFSISWSRILPQGTGKVQMQGIEFYNRVINLCLEMGVEPWVTLYHWDLPQALEEKGGWTNRDIIGWFGDFVAIAIKYFGDRVKKWMVLNEPMVFTGAGYFLGIHAPGRKGLNNFLAATHHAAMCQAEGGRILHSLSTGSKVGTTFSCSMIDPFSNRAADVSAANRVDTLLNRLFVEPLAGLGYPVNDLKMLQRLEPFVKDGDEQKLTHQMDFIGIQNYTREIVKSSIFTPLMRAKIIQAKKRKVETTEMNWEVYPEAIYVMLKKFSRYDLFKEIIVTENGAAFPDKEENGMVNDTKRQIYLEQHIAQVGRARNEGVPVNGYFVWTLMDNFEWAEGYHPRFGLVYVNYENQERIIKQSGHWFSQLINTHNQKVS